MIIAVVGGGIVLFPSLTLLLRLTLGGALGRGDDDARAGPPAGCGGPAPDSALVPVAAPLAGRVAGACLVTGLGLLTVAEAGWAHAVGVVALLAFVVVGFLGVAPALSRRVARVTS